MSIKLDRRLVLRNATAACAIGALANPARRLFAASPLTREDLSIFQQSSAKVSALAGAIGEMQARSKSNPSDPKGWLVNAKAHADFCSIAGADPKQIHFCWWFLSWHRAFIVVTERKLREISGNPNIAFPYWNWSSDRRIPTSFAKASNPLSDAVRRTPARDIFDLEVDYYGNDPVRKKLVVAALGSKSFAASDPNDIGSSFGGIARPNPFGAYQNNRLEGVPHGPIHNYVGGDMGDFETAGRDPIFFAHHGNLDRLWEIWRSDPAKRATEPSSHEFLNHEFPFVWLDGTTIMVSVKETLDTKVLGYQYDSLEVLRPAFTMSVAENDQPDLSPIATANLSVPVAALATAAATSKFTLRISNIEPPAREMNVGVFIKASNDSAPGPGMAVGSFAAVKNGGRVEFPERELNIDISAAVRQLNAANVSVSLIPFSLGDDQGTQFPQLKYQNMQIIHQQ